MKNLKDKSQIHLDKQGTRVRIPWQTWHRHTTWNETCAWAVEQFGLPGDKFTTHATEDYMDFYFKDERDAILFELTRG
jgi:hypothetical protein